MSKQTKAMEHAQIKGRFFSRELSWLTFNRRVLSEACNPENPPFERLKFLAITSSNLDEFYMVRVASLRRALEKGETAPDPFGWAPKAHLEAVLAACRDFIDKRAEALQGIVHDLAPLGLHFALTDDLNPAQLKWVSRYFRKEILPKLAVTHHGGHTPLPHNPRQVMLALSLAGTGKHKPSLAIVTFPAGMPRTVRIPIALGGEVLRLETIVKANMGLLVPHRKTLSLTPFRLTLDADEEVDESGGDLLLQMEETLKKRAKGRIIRFEAMAGIPDTVLKQLLKAYAVSDEIVTITPVPLGLSFLMKEVYGLPGFDHLRYPPFHSRLPDRMLGGQGILGAMAQRDILLHHPYDSFDAVLDFVKEAADDPDVQSIRQTLYRVSGDSPIIHTLCHAAELGKKVTVLLEVKARFDEENNIRWGKVLEKSGCRVLYGLPKLKTHSKITLVTRREHGEIRPYVHLGTGNYNDVTATMYTDFGLLTCDPGLGADAAQFFHMLTGSVKEPEMQRLVYAPQYLRTTLLRLIEAERLAAIEGKPSGIQAKMNALVDPEIIRALYGASLAGVPIHLLVRGVCCLVPGLPGLSETIVVRSIVGRFLEHSRIFRFENAGASRLYLSSADWMPRNLNRRVELMFPVLDPDAKASVEHVLRLEWADTVKAWTLDSDGDYQRVPRDEKAINAQEKLLPTT